MLIKKVLKNFSKVNRQRRLEFHQRVMVVADPVVMAVAPVPVANAVDH